MRRWTEKRLLPGTIIVTACTCTRLCHADNHPSAAGNHGSTSWRVSRGQRAIGPPSMFSASTRPVRGPIPSWCSSVSQERPRACDPPASTALAGLIWKHCNGRVWHHWRPHSEDRSLLPRPSKRAPCSTAAFLHSIILDTGCSSCRLSIFANILRSCGGPKA